MELSLEKLMVHYLKIYPQLSLAGLGEFYVKVVKDDFFYQEGKIYPPFSTVAFNGDRVEGSYSFVEYVQLKKGISAQSAQELIEKFVHSISDKLLQSGKFNISDIGILSIDKNHAIVLDPVQDNFNFIYGNLPSVQAEGLDGTSHEIIETVHLKKENVDKLHNSTKDFKNMANDYDPMQELNDNKPSKSNLWNSILTPLLSLIFALLIGVVLFKQCSSFIKNHKKDSIVERDSSLENEKNITETKINANDAELTELFKNAKYDIEKYKEILTPDIIKKGCIVIVGSFKKSKYADKMERRIIIKGYQPFREEHAEFHRVGILFHCLDHDLVEFIDDIRIKFDQKSWFLVPQLDVPYK